MADSYVYGNTNVLVNTKNIKSRQDLDQFESAMSTLAILKINNTFVFHDLNDIYTIHKMLFDKVYPWAGEIRKMCIFKAEPVLNGLSVSYCDYKVIKTRINKLNTKFLSIKWDELSNEEKINKIVSVFTELWQIHPFREGNTRSVTTLMFLFVKKMGYDLNINYIKKHAKYFRNDYVLACIGEYSEYEHITDFLTNAIIFNTDSLNK